MVVHLDHTQVMFEYQHYWVKVQVTQWKMLMLLPRLVLLLIKNSRPQNRSRLFQAQLVFLLFKYLIFSSKAFGIGPSFKQIFLSHQILCNISGKIQQSFSCRASHINHGWSRSKILQQHQKIGKNNLINSFSHIQLVLT